MRFNKLSVILVVVAVLATVLVSNIVRDMHDSKEKARLEKIVSPAIDKAVEGTPDPKPKLSFLTPTDQSLVVVLSWEQTPEAHIKNDMREKVSTAIRRELSSDPSSWGRHISVIFDDEVVTQGIK
ncbi:hypothetical protein [Bdellovibrio sp. HCB2-146]|uniref:hypothetical protein n=1 Tax=Bdellovibrio sp. HCB2-146 TaxID=3394362 RepID=UPI0039BCE1E4